jgi:lipopolysaccharide transport system ATP-binding protein
MAEVVIHVEQLSKQYALGVVSTGTLAHDLNRWWAKLLHRTDPMMKVGIHSKVRGGNGGHDSIWALKDVSFEVKQGEVLGIVGRNGAGKSTLLKILSRVTAPTAGECRIRGRIASLLEVGTGFHPELTGRENIFLNGTILGMTKEEVRRWFDEIVTFAEIEKFIDTPVKRYSSGMYVRLAFAVAAHMNPEILLVDEVLAVGDAQFQKKCLGKMDEVSRHGRTVLFVSHNMGVISRLCQRALLLDNGQLLADEAASSAVQRYLSIGASQRASTVDLTNFPDRTGDGTARITEACIRDMQGNVSGCFSSGDSITLEFAVQYMSESAPYAHSIEVVNSDGVPIYHLWDLDSRSQDLPVGCNRLVKVTIQDVNLCPDRYHVTLWVGTHEGLRADRVANCLSFTLEAATSRAGHSLDKSKEITYKEGAWTYKPRI